MCPDVFVHDRETGSTERVSVSSDGSEGDWSSFDPSISADGRYVAFSSVASNLVSGDTNGWDDIFVHDRQTGTTECVSVSSNGEQGNSISMYPSISADGHYVAYESLASNLVSEDTNDDWDIFVRDRQTGSTERVSVSSDGVQGNNWSEKASISANNRYVAFMSMSSNLVSGDTIVCYAEISCPDIFVHDRQTGSTERVSVSSNGNQGNAESNHPSISADGRYVAFMSYASNIVSGDTNGTSDVFVHDRKIESTERVSVSNDGSQGNSTSFYLYISAGGRYVAFMSHASNLVSGDTNNAPDIFVRDQGERRVVFYVPVTQNQP
jgi:Tol biopolymer transport system component